MAWCPRCAQSSDVGCESYGQSILSCTENSTHTSSSWNNDPTCEMNDPFFDGYQRRETIALNGNHFTIENWFLYPPGEPCASRSLRCEILFADAWATHCILAASNFYKNLNSVQCNIARSCSFGSVGHCAAVSPRVLFYRVQRQPPMKGHVDKVMADCVVAMNAIIDKNCYEPFVVLKQVGLQVSFASHASQVHFNGSM